MKFLGQVLVCLALASASGAAAAASAPPADAAYLSFAELYRLTVHGASAVDFGAMDLGAAGARSAQPSTEFQVRPVSTAAAFALAPAAASQAAPAAFTVSRASLPEPASRWLLLASGLAVAAWVARRRLGYSL